MSLVEAAGHLTVQKEVALTWPRLCKEVGEMLRPGFETVYAALDPSSLEEDEIGAKLLEGLDDAIAQARELEEMVEEARAQEESEEEPR